MAMALETELATYKTRFDELKADAGRWVLIHGSEVIGTFSSYDEAIREGYKNFKLEPFLVKRIDVTDQAHFISRFVSPIAHVR